MMRLKRPGVVVFCTGEDSAIEKAADVVFAEDEVDASDLKNND